MSVAGTQAPTVPPRPPRSQDKDSIPKIPPRPINRRIDRSISPHADRYAPSPLNESPFLSKSPRSHRSVPGYNGEPIERTKSVDMPSLGEEGNEYAGLDRELSNTSREQSSSPEHTRIVGDDVQLHAPKPSLPAQSAKQRVKTVTRTDSDRAASFGIGRPSGDEHNGPSSNRSLKKQPSTISQHSHNESHTEDEQGIPEIGQQVPMYPNAGDVQAPSPAPGVSAITEGLKAKHHTRKTSARGLPPGSYGLHGHGMLPQAKLEKAYFDKHPELLKKEHTPHHHDRPNDFSMSSEDLNKIVRETHSRGLGASYKNYPGTPSDQIGWQAMEESTSRVASPGLSPTGLKSPVKGNFKTESSTDAKTAGHRLPEDGGVIHVDEPGRRKSVLFNEGDLSASQNEEQGYTAPILADDEIRKDPSPYSFQAAIEPPPERRGSAYEMEPSSRPTSRPSSRPTSIYREAVHSTPLEDVEEYEPLFPEEGKASIAKSHPENQTRRKDKYQHGFPSRDVWEDAPDSVHYTADVLTPDVAQDQQPQPPPTAAPAPKDGETIAQAFARHQEELAEKDTRKHGPDTFLPAKNTQKPMSWIQHQPHLTAAKPTRPDMAPRFPSRDVWEDSPDSLQLETTVSHPQEEDRVPDSATEHRSPDVPQRPTRKSTDPSSASSDKPFIPERPKPKQTASQENVNSPPPAISTSPSKGPYVPAKPEIPARPTKAGPTSGGLEPAEAAAPPPRQKPAVPVRPMGSKIAALQAGFMSDLNKKLGLGPQAPKKEEPAAEDEVADEKEKVPLSDARKGRARGPQRRAPAKSPSPAAALSRAEEPAKATASLAICVPFTVFEIDPDAGEVSLGDVTEIDTSSTTQHAADATDAQKGKAASDAKSSEEKKPAEEQKSTSETKPAGQTTQGIEGTTEKTKSLATNMAGEAVVEEKLEVDQKHQEVEPTEVEEH